MRTYSHGVIGYLLYAKRSRQERRLAMLGGIVPDVFLVIGFMSHAIERVTSSSRVAELHHLLHFSTLHTVTICMHSFVIVGLLLVASLMIYRPALPFLVGMLAHGSVDLLTHEQWAYNHFFPIPVAPIRSIISYTDMTFTLAEHVLLLLFIAWWLSRRKSR